MKNLKKDNVKIEEEFFSISQFKGRIDDLHNKAIFNQDYAVDFA